MDSFPGEGVRLSPLCKMDHDLERQYFDHPAHSTSLLGWQQ